MADSFQDRCSCEDCEAAVSPGAYLASLLDYTLKHVLGDGPIDTPFLEARFHQPFSALPLDCSAASVKVHQARLAVETLRSYLGARPLFDSFLEKSLADAEASYRLTAYIELLTQNGVDYEDIRRARTAKPGDRAALASRLGIRLTTTAAVPRRDELDRLYLDPLVPLSDPSGLWKRCSAWATRSEIGFPRASSSAMLRTRSRNGALRELRGIETRMSRGGFISAL